MCLFLREVLIIQEVLRLEELVALLLVLVDQEARVSLFGPFLRQLISHSDFLCAFLESGPESYYQGEEVAETGRYACFAQRVLWLFMYASMSMSMESLADNPVFVLREVLTVQEVLVSC